LVWRKRTKKGANMWEAVLSMRPKSLAIKDLTWSVN
jgi:hypothetical protein